MNAWIIIGCAIAVAFVFCVLLFIANHSGERFMEKYEKMNNIIAETRLSPKEFIDFIHKTYLKGNLEIVQISRIAGDAYSKGKLFLSGDTIYKNTLASFTIIAHEMGHALQDHEGRKLKRLNFLRKLGKILGALMFPSLVAGIILLFFKNLFVVAISLICFAVFVFLLALIVKIITISIEKDASKKAIIFLKDVLNEKQLKKCKKFLNSARLTYWGEFLRILLIWTGFSRKAKLFN